MVSQGSNGEGGKKANKEKKWNRKKEGGTFRVPGVLLLRAWEVAEAHLPAALAEAGGDGDDRDDGGGGGDKKGVVVVVVGRQESHLLWYGLQLGWDPPFPQLTTMRLGVVGTGHTNSSLPAEAGSEKLRGSQ